MKIYFVLVLLCFSLTISTLGFTREVTISEWDECLKQEKISKETFQDLKRRKSPVLDCFNACLMKKRGSMRTNGQIDTEKFLSTLKKMGLMNQSRTDEKFMDCASTANREMDECSVAKNMLDCFFH